MRMRKKLIKKLNISNQSISINSYQNYLVFKNLNNYNLKCYLYFNKFKFNLIPSISNYTWFYNYDFDIKKFTINHNKYYHNIQYNNIYYKLLTLKSSNLGVIYKNKYIVKSNLNIFSFFFISFYLFLINLTTIRFYLFILFFNNNNLLIFLKQYKPRSPGIRWKKYMVPLKLNSLSYKLISKLIKSNKSKNNSIFSKRVKTTCLFLNQTHMTSFFNLGIVFGMFLINHRKIVNINKLSNGIVYAAKSINGLFSGDFIKLLSLPLKVYRLSLLGCIIPLKFLKTNFIFSNISKINSKYKYITSNGTYGILLSKNIELGLVLIKLPSGKKIYLKDDLFCILGRNNLVNFKYSIFGKSGLNRNLGNNIMVRGVAKNPVDHPHGGRTKTNQPEVSPWGWIAKHNK